ncbi:hypothetical protein DY000_02047365 [Brassica cretica]|uniref:Uncharacterized protein n=1 Tax=Brassica cretica TaxID=69181 RepID=A0ABQ7F522_BRACR|nr:hypothetical protein DY000_02047365 [Brassica cretica]
MKKSFQFPLTDNSELIVTGATTSSVTVNAHVSGSVVVSSQPNENCQSFATDFRKV